MELVDRLYGQFISSHHISRVGSLATLQLTVTSWLSENDVTQLCLLFDQNAEEAEEAIRLLVSKWRECKYIEAYRDEWWLINKDKFVKKQQEEQPKIESLSLSLEPWITHQDCPKTRFEVERFIERNIPAKDKALVPCAANKIVDRWIQEEKISFEQPNLLPESIEMKKRSPSKYAEDEESETESPTVGPFPLFDPVGSSDANITVEELLLENRTLHKRINSMHETIETKDLLIQQLHDRLLKITTEMLENSEGQNKKRMRGVDSPDGKKPQQKKVLTQTGKSNELSSSKVKQKLTF